MVDFWDITMLIEDIKGLEERLKAVEYAERLEQEHMQGENPSTMKGHLRMLRIKFLLIEWLAHEFDRAPPPPTTPQAIKKPSNDLPKKHTARKVNKATTSA